MVVLEKGDDVVIFSGILGKINKVEDEIIILEVGSKIYIRVIWNVIFKEMMDFFYVD